MSANNPSGVVWTVGDAMLGLATSAGSGQPVRRSQSTGDIVELAGPPSPDWNARNARNARMRRPVRPAIERVDPADGTIDSHSAPGRVAVARVELLRLGHLSFAERVLDALDAAYRNRVIDETELDRRIEAIRVAATRPATEPVKG